MPADGQRVAAVGRDRDVEHLVAQVEQVDRVGAELAVADQVGGEHQDAVVVVAGAELAGRADHAVADVAVGLARGDREAAGQHGTGQRDDDVVADGEVARAADDAPRLAPRRRRPCTSGSSCRWRRSRPRTTSTRPSTSGPSMSWPGRSTVSTSRPAATSRSASSRAGDVGRQVGVVPQPGQRRPHQSSVPNGRAKRTSPSTMSRMSSAPCRDIRVRSMPMPNAKPV